MHLPFLPVVEELGQGSCKWIISHVCALAFFVWLLQVMKLRKITGDVNARAAELAKAETLLMADKNKARENSNAHETDTDAAESDSTALGTRSLPDLTGVISAQRLAAMKALAYVGQKTRPFCGASLEHVVETIVEQCLAGNP